MSGTTSPHIPPSRDGKGGSGARQRVITLFSILPWALLLIEFLFILPRYEQLFRQFAIKIDAFSTLLLEISAWVRAHVLAAFLITFALMIVNVCVSVVVQSARISRRRRMTVLLFVFGIPCLLFVLTWVGVLLTHRRLVEGLQR